MFEVNGKYANRKGEYTVLAINPPKMHIRYDDGAEATVKIGIQERIWANIASEREREDAKTKKRAQQNKHFIKVIRVPNPDDLSFPGWHERVIMAPDQQIIDTVKPGDRIIFFDMESRTFIAVATITGKSFTKNPQDYFFATEEKKATFFPIDRDADTHQLELGLPTESVEMESHPDFASKELVPEMMLPITEDEFELLAETLAEVSEDEDIDEDIDEEEDE
ncbi:MAG: hypothetical protein ACE5FD_09615 [Anaerolineae bacterium]